MDYKNIERNVQKQIEDFKARDSPQRQRYLKRPDPSFNKTKLRVTIKVRTKQLAPDVWFTHDSTSISELEAIIEAKKKAVESGYKIFGWVHDVERFD